MKLNVQILLLLVSSFLLTNCASLKSNKGVYRESTLSNLNPAPSSMQPPHMVNGKDPSVDPMYMRTQADYYFSVGEVHSLDGDSEKAIEAFKLAAVYDAESPEIRIRWSQEYIKLGLLSESIEQAEEALKLDPNNLEARLLLGNLYSSLKMYKQAIKQYEFLAITHPDNPKIPFYMGAVKAEQGIFDEAIEYFKKAASHPKAEKAYAAHYYIGKVWVNKGEEFYSKALTAFAKSLSIEPDYEDAVLSMSAVYQLMGKEEKGVKLVASFQKKFGPKKSIALFLSQYYLEKEKYDHAFEQLGYLEGFERDNLSVKMKMALILITKKKYPQAIEKLEEILVFSPESDKIRFNLGAVYEEMKQYKNAVAHFEQIKSTSTYYAEAVIHSSFLHRQMGDMSKALDRIEDGIRERDDIPQFYSFYASLLDEQEEYEESYKMLSKAVKKFPKNTQILFFLGSTLDRLGKTDKSIDKFKKVLDIDSQHIQALNYLAYTYAERNKNLDEAMELARRALEIQPNDGYIMDTIGWIYFKKGEIKPAIRYLEAAYQKKPTESIVAEHLGDAYYKYQMVQKAKKMYLKAVEIEKDNKKVKRIRRKIFAIENQVVPRRTPASEK